MNFCAKDYCSMFACYDYHLFTIRTTEVILKPRQLVNKKTVLLRTFFLRVFSVTPHSNSGRKHFIVSKQLILSEKSIMTCTEMARRAVCTLI